MSDGENHLAPPGRKGPPMSEDTRQDSNDSFYSTESMEGDAFTGADTQHPNSNIERRMENGEEGEEKEHTHGDRGSDPPSETETQTEKGEDGAGESEKALAGRGGDKGRGDGSREQKGREKDKGKREGQGERRGSKEREKEQRGAKGGAVRPHQQVPPRMQATVTAWGPPAAGTQPWGVHEVGPRRVRVLMIANVKGWLGVINQMAMSSGAAFVVCCGDFGFFDQSSYDIVSIRELRQRVKDIPPPSISEEERARILALPEKDLRGFCRAKGLLGNLPLYLSGKERLLVPVYTSWGAHEDLRVLERFRSGQYKVDNLHILDETTSYKVHDIRIFGLGGGIKYDQLFNNGDGDTEIAGKADSIWTTMLQVGRLLQTAERVQGSNEVREVRVLATHVSAGMEPLVAMLAQALQCDFAISGHLTMRYCLAHNLWAVLEATNWSATLKHMRDTIGGYWDQIKESVAPVCRDDEMDMFTRAITLVKSDPKLDDLRSVWHIGLPNADCGCSYLSIENGKIGIETLSDGIDYALRKKHLLPSGRRDTTTQTTTPSSGNINPAEGREEESQHAAPSRTQPNQSSLTDSPRGQHSDEVINRDDDVDREGSDQGDAASETTGRGRDWQREEEGGAHVQGGQGDRGKGGKAKGTDRERERERGREGERRGSGGAVVPGQKGTCTAYVRGFPHNVTVEEVRAVFAGLKIRDVILQQNNGACFVYFDDEDSFNAALNSKHEVAGRRVTVDVARPRKPMGERKRPPTRDYPPQRNPRREN